jgi:hypothetical protein
LIGWGKGIRTPIHGVRVVLRQEIKGNARRTNATKILRKSKIVKGDG